MKPNTGRIKRRTLPASGEKATFHVKQPGAAGRGGAFCRLRAEISCQGGKALLLYLKGGQRSISKAAVGFKGSGLSQRQRSASKAMVCFKGNDLLQEQWRVAFQAPYAANCRVRSSFKYLCNNQTSIRHSRVLAHRERQGCLNSPFRRTMRHGAIRVSFIRIGFQINAVGVSPSYSGKVFYHIRAFQQFVSS